MADILSAYGPLLFRHIPSGYSEYIGSGVVHIV